MKNVYPNYRSSGVDWLGDLPAHWDVRQLGTAMAETVGGGTPSTTNDAYWSDEGDEGVSWVAIADMSHGGDIAATEKRVTALGCSAARLRLLPPETVIYSMYASVGVAARLAITATTNQAILGLLPREELQTRFLYWYLTGIQSSVLSLTRDNTQSNLNTETVRKFPVLLPPVDEQRAIAEYLDRETEEIDTLVAKKRLLLERLAEYRKALITGAVTRGLPPEVALAAGFDPSPPLKPSGVDWLGDVPAHWEVKHLRTIAHFRSGVYIDAGEIIESGAFPVFGGNGIRGFVDRYNHEGEFVVIGRVGALCGNVHAASGRFWVSNNAVTLAPISCNTPWLWRALSVMELNAYSLASAQPALAIEHIKVLSLPVPPMEEQRAIAEFLDERTGRIDRLCSKVEEAIERLHEYRTALVTAAVTGKIDVRDVPTVKARSINT